MPPWKGAGGREGHLGGGLLPPRVIKGGELALPGPPLRRRTLAAAPWGPTVSTSRALSLCSFLPGPSPPWRGGGCFLQTARSPPCSSVVRGGDNGPSCPMQPLWECIPGSPKVRRQESPAGREAGPGDREPGAANLSYDTNHLAWGPPRGTRKSPGGLDGSLCFPASCWHLHFLQTGGPHLVWDTTTGL